jgi:hypothetical protein
MQLKWMGIQIHFMMNGTQTDQIYCIFILSFYYFSSIIE